MDNLIATALAFGVIVFLQCACICRFHHDIGRLYEKIDKLTSTFPYITPNYKGVQYFIVFMKITGKFNLQNPKKILTKTKVLDSF